MNWIVCIIVCFISFQSLAKEVEFPNEAETNGKKLELVGQGWRKATWFRVKVYKAALYTEKKTPSEKILESQQVKMIDMKFSRDIDKEDLEKVWRESLKQACPDPCKINYSAFLDKIQDIKEGHKHRYVFYTDKVEIDRNGSKVTHKDGNLSKMLLANWIGANPLSDDLKKALLGK